MWNSGEGSRGGESSEVLIYDVNGFPDGDGEPLGAGASAYVRALAPFRYDGLYRQTVQHRARGFRRWLVTVDYGDKASEKDDSGEDPVETIGVAWALKTENVKRLVSIETLDSYNAAGHTEIDFKGAINVSKDKVEGVDVPVPVTTLTLTVKRKPADLTGEYFAALFACVGKTNDAEFFGLPARTLLFLGTDVQYVYDVTTPADEQSPLDLPLHFGYSPSSTINVGDITDIDKPGWALAWPYFEETDYAGGQLLIVKPVQVNVERVFDEADFSALGIGTNWPGA